MDGATIGVYALDLVHKSILYCIVCFKNKRMYKLMMADMAAETCSC